MPLPSDPYPITRAGRMTWLLGLVTARSRTDREWLMRQYVGLWNYWSVPHDQSGRRRRLLLYNDIKVLERAGFVRREPSEIVLLDRAGAVAAFEGGAAWWNTRWADEVAAYKERLEHER